MKMTFSGKLSEYLQRKSQKHINVCMLTIKSTLPPVTFIVGWSLKQFSGRFHIVRFSNTVKICIIGIWF